MKMHYLNFIVVLLFLSFQQVVNAQDISDLKTSYSFQENLVLGEQINKQDIVFGLPSAAISDSKGNIIVADDKFGAIRVFNKEGKSIFNFGGNGRGPGEFTEVTSMTLLPNDEILIFDFFQQRFTKYSTNGEVLGVYMAPWGMSLKPDYMRYIPRVGIALFFRKLEGIRGVISPEEDYLIHIISEDFQELTEEFAPITHTIDTTQSFELYFEGGVYRGIFTTGENSLTLAPFFYRGKIQQYVRKSSWELEKTFDGYTEVDKPYVQYEDPEKVLGKGMLTNSARHGKLYGIMNNESLGLFQKSNGDYLYIGLLKIGKRQRLYAQIFDESGELKSHGLINNLDAGLQETGYYQRMRFYWMDEKNQIYIIDQTERDGILVRRGVLEKK